MGQGEEVRTRPEPHVEIQERGKIFFFYRPKVNKDEAHTLDDVQRMYIVLRPESGERSSQQKQASDSGKNKQLPSSSKNSPDNNTSSNGDKHADDEGKPAAGDDRGSEGGHGCEEVNIEKQALLRLIVMGQKSLPDPAAHRDHRRPRPNWGFVEIVTTNPEDIKTALKGEDYDTATRGHRQKPPARALGEGVYRILRHRPSSGRSRATHTHLIYKLELPSTTSENDPQESMNVKTEGSFLIQIKNPEQGSGNGGGFRGLQSKRKAVFPAHLQGHLGSRRFSPADPPDFLNYEGCEFLLISASDDIEEELGLELKGEIDEEETEHNDEQSKECSDLISMFGETVSTKPLFTGAWV